MNTSNNRRDCDSKSLFPPKVKAGKNTENSPSREHIVEVCNNVIGVMNSNVNTSIRKSNTCKPPNSKKEKETDSKKSCWLVELNTSTSSSSEPAKNLDSSWNCNNSCSSCKIGARVNVETCNVSVVSSNEETEDTDRNSSVNSTKIAENRLSRISCKCL